MKNTITAIRIHPCEEVHATGEVLHHSDGTPHDNSSTFLVEIELGSSAPVDCWGVYLRHQDGTLEWVMDFKEAREALGYARFLAEHKKVQVIENPWGIGQPET